MAKYKVGDKLRCIDGPTKGAGWREGKVFTVKEISDYTEPIYWPVEQDPDGCGVYEDSVELFSEHCKLCNEVNKHDGKELITKGKTIMSNAVNFVKKNALRVSNPDEYELREAGLHSDCGELTAEGKDLRDSFLEELVHSKMVETAKAINAEKVK